MIRRLVILIIVVLAMASPSFANQHQALILYDGTSQKLHEGITDGINIANLLGHFDYHPTLKPIENYRAGEMARYDAVFVVGGSEKTVWPASVLRDARSRTAMLAWLGYGMDVFLSNHEARKRGLRVDSVLTNSRYNQVLYRGTVLGKGGSMVTLLTVTDPSRVKIEAEMLDPERPPIALHGARGKSLAGGGCAVRLHRGPGPLSRLLRPDARHARRKPCHLAAGADPSGRRRPG